MPKNYEDECERADQLRDEYLDRLSEANLCLRCNGPMPPRPEPPYHRPANCPTCRPAQWEQYNQNKL